MRLHSLKRFKFIYFFVLQRVLGLTSRFVICPRRSQYCSITFKFNRISESSTQSHHPFVTHTHSTADVKNELISLSNLITKFLEDYVTSVADSPNLFGLTPVLVIILLPPTPTSYCRWKEETEAAYFYKKYSSDFFRGHHSLQCTRSRKRLLLRARRKPHRFVIGDAN